MTTAKAGDLVHVHYTGRFLDGTEFDTMDSDEPIDFVVGGDDVLTGLSAGVAGMACGEERTLTVPPAEGFGVRDDELAFTVPSESLPDDTDIGDALSVETDEGELICWVSGIEGDTAVLDPNHPFAGATLVFDVKMVSIGEATA